MNNETLKKSISQRATKVGPKVKKYVNEALLEKIDQAGPAAAFWLEKLESDFDKLKAHGHMKGFEDSDFNDLYFVITGQKRKSRRADGPTEEAAHSIMATCIRDALMEIRIAESVKTQKGPRWEAPQGGRRLWRREKPDGGYEYRETPPDGQDKPKERPAEKSEGQSKPKTYKNLVRLTKPDLEKTLSHGHFSVISAGRNPDDAKESKMEPNDEFFHKRHEQLRDELEKQNLRYTEVVGHYGGKETSFLVFHDGTELTPKTQKSMLIHHHDVHELVKNRKAIEELGKRYNQNSVLHGNGGKNKLVFTAGEKVGQECGGKGWKEMPEAKDYYTDIKLEGKEHTKFNLDISECFEKGFL